MTTATKATRPSKTERDFVQGFIRELQARGAEIEAANGHIITTAHNTAVVMRCLQKAVTDAGYIPLSIFLAAACEYERQAS